MAGELTVAEYQKLAEAENAVMVLDREGFPMAQVSIFAQGVEDGQDVNEAEVYLVVVEGTDKDVEKARNILRDTPAEEVEIREE
jgi:hypothetical protein